LYYKPTKQAPKANPALSKWVKDLIEELSFTEYRTITFLLGFEPKRDSIGSRAGSAAPANFWTGD